MKDAPQISFQSHQFNDYDPEQLREVINGADMEHTILASGRCSAKVQHFQSRRLAVNWGFYKFPVVARGQFPAGKISIGVSWGKRVSAWSNGSVLDRADVQVYGEDTDLLYRAGAGTGWLVVVVDREQLQQESLDRLGRELPLPSGGSWNLSVPHRFARQLVDLILTTGRQFDTLTGDREIADHSILAACVDAITVGADSAQLSAIEKRSQHRYDLIRRADTAMRCLVGSKYSSAQLCRHLGVTERKLQLHFKEAFGLTPKAWFQRLALNRAYAELVRRQTSNSLVTEVALDCGFEHLGRFAKSYRELFGKSPSATVRECRG